MCSLLEKRRGSEERLFFSKLLVLLQPISWPAVALYFLIGGGLVWFYIEEKKKSDASRFCWCCCAIAHTFAFFLSFPELREKLSKSVGAARIGGPWTLVDQYGNPISDAEFRGKYLFLYFGFTHCPDICPTELSLMTNVLENLGKLLMMECV
jgi:hypothetical protein